MASATVLGSVIGVDTAPSVSAEPCTGAAAAVPTPAAPIATPIPEPTTGSSPIGRRPAGANENAPLPNLGRLPLQILTSIAPLVKQGQRQGENMALPEPPAPQPVHTANPPHPAAPAQQAATPPPNSGGAPGTSIVGWVTGPQGPGQTLPRFGISGTDLGIMWDNGDPGNDQVLMAFGDTYGYCGVPGHQWRYNTLLRTQDRSLAQGVRVADGSRTNAYAGSPSWASGLSKQIVTPPKWAAREVGIIPTSGTSVGRMQYLNFMSIRSWDSNGEWTTNYSAVAASQDNGQNWTVLPATVRTPTPDRVPAATFVPGNEHFQQGAFLKPGPGDPYLYSFGTSSGRSGPAYIARIPDGQVADVTKWEYWNSDSNSWVPNNPDAASVVIPGPVGEMSAQYNRYLNQYLVLYCNRANDVVARTAPAPQGPWGPEQVLVTSAEVPGGIYAPFLHPWSTGRDVYYNLSLWSAYNVMLMKTTLP